MAQPEWLWCVSGWRWKHVSQLGGGKVGPPGPRDRADAATERISRPPRPRRRNATNKACLIAEILNKYGLVFALPLCDKGLFCSLLAHHA
jgi:hypothetical protein